jgi:hypothetical protein
MMSTLVRVRIEKDGTVKFPPRVLRELGIEPPQEIELSLQIPTKARKPIKLTDEDRALFDRAAELLRASFKGVDIDEAWQEIKAARRDRWL